MKRLESILIWFLALSLVIGQILRWRLFGQSGGLLVSDLAVVLILLVASSKYYVSRQNYNLSASTADPPSPGGQPITYNLLFTPFIIWSLFTLVVNATNFDSRELLIAFSYWLRTSCYLLLTPALIYLAQTPRNHTTLKYSFLSAGGGLIILGLLQVLFFRDLAALPSFLLQAAGSGWDPHEGRLVSTWLDPNFFGVFSALFLMSATSLLFAVPASQKRLLLVLIGLTVVAFIATQSRSSFIALLFTVGLLSPFFIVRLSISQWQRALPTLVSFGSLTLVLSIIAAVVLGDRLGGLITYDPTVAARAEALGATWQLAKEVSWVGVGYNAFQFAALRFGIVSDIGLHSRAGADNSWLTLWVTTGVPGALLFALPWLTLGRRALETWLRFGNSLAFAAAAGILILAIHSQFINSFLYGHLLITLAYLAALGLEHHKTA